MHQVDFFVTGSNDETLSEPKCLLKRILKVVIFPQVEQLVQSGGEFENSQVVIQGDRAGPHDHAMLKAFVNDYLHQEGWKWYPQAPHIPHANVLYLGVFPTVIRRHCNLIRKKNWL